MTDEESVPMKNLDNNGVDETEPTEKSPLNGDTDLEAAAAATDKELEANGANGKEKQAEAAKAGGFGALLSHPRTRIIGIAALVSFFGFIAIVIGLVLFTAGAMPEEWIEDGTLRILKLTPTPNGFKNQIKFRAGHGSEGSVYPGLVEQINALYELYSPQRLQDNANFTMCSNNQPPPTESLACFFDLEPIRKLCGQDANSTYGYADGSPCIFLQLNYRELANFTPIAYSPEELKNEPNLPDELRKVQRLVGPYVECRGNTPVDVEKAGKITLAPGHLLSQSFFPYTGHRDYLSPVIAIKFEKPATGIDIGVTCRFWAKNIGTRIVTDETTNSTRVEPINEELPSAELPFNLYIE